MSNLRDGLWRRFELVIRDCFLGNGQGLHQQILNEAEFNLIFEAFQGNIEKLLSWQFQWNHYIIPVT